MKNKGNAVRKKDLATGHSCYPPQILDQASPDVFVNNRPVVRKGDSTEFHICIPGEKAHHAFVRIIDERTPAHYTYMQHPEKFTVWINGIPPARMKDRFEYATNTDGDLLDPDRLLEVGEESFCEGMIMTGSKNVFFEDGKDI